MRAVRAPRAALRAQLHQVEGQLDHERRAHAASRAAAAAREAELESSASGTLSALAELQRDLQESALRIRGARTRPDPGAPLVALGPRTLADGAAHAHPHHERLPALQKLERLVVFTARVRCADADLEDERALALTRQQELEQQLAAATQGLPASAGLGASSSNLHAQQVPPSPPRCPLALSPASSLHALPPFLSAHKPSERA